MTTQPSGREPQEPTQSIHPSAERPAGPPSGPLSGGREGPPPPPPPAPPGGTPPGPPSGPPSRVPWWRSGPRLATALVALAAAVALAVVLTRPGGAPSAGGEVFLQPAAATGPDPFTESTAAKDASPPPQTAKPPARPQSAAPTGAIVTRSISGSAPGLYGGTKATASCDVEKQIGALTAQPAKNSAFASALGIPPATVPGYLRSLTPVQLGMDTRVTNHGYRDGKATSYQAVLQAGTAVLVDARGVPRVRCACGNPLGSPVALKANPKRSGQPWSSYEPKNVVVVAPSVTVVRKFVIYDRHDRHWFERDRGDHHGERDKPVPPPVVPKPPITPVQPSPSVTKASPSPAGSPTKSGRPPESPSKPESTAPSEHASRAPLRPEPPTPPLTPTPPPTPQSEAPPASLTPPVSKPASAPASSKAPAPPPSSSEPPSPAPPSPVAPELRQRSKPPGPDPDETPRAGTPTAPPTTERHGTDGDAGN
ncbi:DUF6777 domain-containing protein [Streptomyces sp. XY332]|uniref:DUF6777 domain-containing protein n=1 Tax=Streptomyces sp. XY332 TaxID=1415561 RepID=UPI000B262D33|nr:DUF6777 domain-containing protein [Streptomyces sp. XY332]